MGVGGAVWWVTASPSTTPAPFPPFTLFATSPQFFTELSKRGNSPIYNLFPDTLSCLSRLVAAGAAGGVGGATVTALDASTFRDIVCFLLSFVSKDKHADSLGEKLLGRLEAACSGPAGDGALARDIAFCIAQLPVSEKAVRRLAEGVKGYARVLGDGDVWASFSDILAKVRGGGG